MRLGFVITPVFLLAMMSACDTNSPAATSNNDHPWSDTIITPSEAALSDDISMVFYHVYVTGNSGDSPQGSMLVLVSEDGSIQSLHIGTMLEGTPTWTNNGIYFADKDNDYILTDDGLQTFPNSKPWSQLGALPTDDGFIGIYNEGFTEKGGYHSQYVHVTSKGVQESRYIEGWIPYTINCDGTIYGVAPVSGNLLAEQLDDAQNPERHAALVKIDPLSSTGVEVIAWTDDTDLSADGKSQVCVDDSIAFVGTYEDDDGELTPVVIQWNLATGEYHEANILDENGSPPTGEDLVYARQQGMNMRTGTDDSSEKSSKTVEWYRRDGSIMSTVIATGQSSVLFETGIVWDDTYFTIAHFTDKYVHLLSEGLDGASPLQYRIFDRVTGNEFRSMEFNGAESSQYSIEGFAVKPGN